MGARTACIACRGVHSVLAEAWLPAAAAAVLPCCPPRAARRAAGRRNQGATPDATSRPLDPQAFQRADAETRRCQYRSLLRRFTQGKADQVAACLSHWLGAGGAAAAAGVAGGGGAAGNVADVGTSDGADAGAVAAAGSVPSGRSHQERLQANWATQT